MTRIRDYRNNNQRLCFTYDPQDRLVEAMTGTNDCVSYAPLRGDGVYDHTEDNGYTYSDIGNLTSLGGVSYTYAQTGNAGPHAPTQVGTVTFVYDPNGNRLTATDGPDDTTYHYDDDNRLEAIDLPNTTDDLGFTYDADGQRVQRSAGSDHTMYVGGLMEVDLDGTTVTETRKLYGFGGVPVAVRTFTTTAEETTYLFTDHLGSVVSSWNDTTDTRTLTRYFPYGGERHSTREMPQDQRYTGQVSDATANASGGSGLLYYNARYYDPTTAQFTQPDTIVPDPSSPGDLNRYSYVRGNPVRYTDPSGHCTDTTLWGTGSDASGGNPMASDPSCRSDPWGTLSDGLGAFGGWIWEHRQQILALGVAGVCVAVSAGVFTTGCGYAATGLFVEREIELAFTAQSFGDFAIGTVWNAGTSYVFLLAGGAGLILDTSGYIVAVQATGGEVAILTLLIEGFAVTCSFIERCRQDPQTYAHNLEEQLSSEYGIDVTLSPQTQRSTVRVSPFRSVV